METEYFASINEVSKRLDVPAHTLRYWEKQFPTMIRPTTGAGGRRYYRAEMVDRLFVIKDLLYNRGMTIAGVKKIMREGNFPKTTDEFDSVASPTAVGVPPVVPMQISPCSVSAGEIKQAINLLIQAKNLLQ